MFSGLEWDNNGQQISYDDTNYVVSEHKYGTTVRIIKTGDEKSNKCITFNNKKEAKTFVERLIVGMQYDTEYEWQVGID